MPENAHAQTPAGKTSLELEVKLEILRDPALRSVYPCRPERYSELPLPDNIRALLEGHLPVRFEFQQDEYYQHPCWDLKEKNMALRYRISQSYVAGPNGWQPAGIDNVLTYKGPPLDAAFKLRDEKEFAVPEEMWDVLRAFGFKATAMVSKDRWFFVLPQTEDKIEFSLDAVNGLGIFIEVEMMVTDQADLPAAEARLRDFLRSTGLDGYRHQPVSYLGLLLGGT